MSKAQGISINTIIIAAIALIVLVLLVLIVTGNLKNWNKTANECRTRNGVCMSEESCKSDPDNGIMVSVVNLKCEGNNVCCVGVGVHDIDSSDGDSPNQIQTAPSTQFPT